MGAMGKPVHSALRRKCTTHACEGFGHFLTIKLIRRLLSLQPEADLRSGER